MVHAQITVKFFRYEDLKNQIVLTSPLFGSMALRGSC